MGTKAFQRAMGVMVQGGHDGRTAGSPSTAMQPERQNESEGSPTRNRFMRFHLNREPRPTA